MAENNAVNSFDAIESVSVNRSSRKPVAGDEIFVRDGDYEFSLQWDKIVLDTSLFKIGR